MMNAEEFKQRFMPYHRMLYRVAFGLTGNQQDAEDLLQDTFMRMWQKREQLTSALVNEAYLIIMMRNLYMDRARVKTPDTSIPLESVCMASDPNRPDDKAERRNEAFLMKELIEHLPQKEKDIIRMYLLEELSYEEMEASTGMKQGNLRQIVLRTRNKLKEQFTKIAQSWKN